MRRKITCHACYGCLLIVKGKGYFSEDFTSIHKQSCSFVQIYFCSKIARKNFRYAFFRFWRYQEIYDEGWEVLRSYLILKSYMISIGLKVLIYKIFEFADHESKIKISKSKMTALIPNMAASTSRPQTRDQRFRKISYTNFKKIWSKNTWVNFSHAFGSSSVP